MQVRIVHEGMRFPLWLHGHTVFTLQVASVFPKNVVGTEVVVAPKRRKKSLDSTGDSHLDSSNKEHAAKMLLRLQYPDGLCSTKLPILMSKELSFL
ncbi:hypothetical protein JHK87_055103 [Glycine soja]|nr:hypothetical protein JHK87_055103 [Glycine soja]